MSEAKSSHTGTVTKSIIAKVPLSKAWDAISNIGGLELWVKDVQDTTMLTKKKKGIGAVRLITFKDGNKVKEYIVGWKERVYISYIAVSGLPLKAYHATIELEPIQKGTKIRWQSFFCSKKMTDKEFEEFVKFLRGFYGESLKTMKKNLERA